MKKVFLIAFLSMAVSIGLSQTQKSLVIKKHSICRINMQTGDEYDCKKGEGPMMIKRISIMPHNRLTIMFENNEVINTDWDKKNIRMNEDEDLYIYVWEIIDLNKENGMAINFIMRLDYSLQQGVVYMKNPEGSLIRIDLF